MTLTEIFDRVLLDSGAFLIGPTDIELDVPKFKTLVSRVLGIYNKYCPHDEMRTIESGMMTYTFPDPAPRWVADVIPVSNPMILTAFLNYNSGDPINFVWKYIKPILILPLSGTFNVTCVFDHQITALAENTSKYEVLTITDNDDLFFKILTGFFMVALGRSRKAFTVTEIPISNDAAEMVSDGTTMTTEAMTALAETDSKFYLAWG